MRKLVAAAFVSLDGVMQAPGGPTEDPTGGFTLGGWTVNYWDDAMGPFMGDMFANPFDLLLGRKTYEIFAAYWPYYDQADTDGGIAGLFNRIRKYVVSRSGDVNTSWVDSVLLRDIADVKRLRQGDGPNLVTQGSSELVQALLANDLVDAMTIFTVPVVLGGGKRLFADGAAPHSFNLAGSRVCASGIMVGRYERAGDVRIADTAMATPSDAERARQERMKRED